MVPGIGTPPLRLARAGICGHAPAACPSLSPRWWPKPGPPGRLDLEVEGFAAFLASGCGPAERPEAARERLCCPTCTWPTGASRGSPAALAAFRRAHDGSSRRWCAGSAAARWRRRTSSRSSSPGSSWPSREDAEDRRVPREGAGPVGTGSRGADVLECGAARPGGGPSAGSEDPALLVWEGGDDPELAFLKAGTARFKGAFEAAVAALPIGSALLWHRPWLVTRRSDRGVYTCTAPRPPARGQARERCSPAPGGPHGAAGRGPGGAGEHPLH